MALQKNFTLPVNTIPPKQNKHSQTINPTNTTIPSTKSPNTTAENLPTQPPFLPSHKTMNTTANHSILTKNATTLDSPLAANTTSPDIPLEQKSLNKTTQPILTPKTHQNQTILTNKALENTPSNKTLSPIPSPVFPLHNTTTITTQTTANTTSPNIGMNHNIKLKNTTLTPNIPLHHTLQNITQPSQLPTNTKTQNVHPMTIQQFLSEQNQKQQQLSQPCNSSQHSSLLLDVNTNYQKPLAQASSKDTTSGKTSSADNASSEASTLSVSDKQKPSQKTSSSASSSQNSSPSGDNQKPSQKSSSEKKSSSASSSSKRNSNKPTEIVSQNIIKHSKTTSLSSSLSSSSPPSSQSSSSSSSSKKHKSSANKMPTAISQKIRKSTATQTSVVPPRATQTSVIPSRATQTSVIPPRATQTSAVPTTAAPNSVQKPSGSASFNSRAGDSSVKVLASNETPYITNMGPCVGVVNGSGGAGSFVATG